jgi:pyruvate dehydrogenase E1 component beta subunit
MLLAALDDPDPVFLFEHALLYPLEAEIDEEPRAVDITRAAVRREGDDVTLVTYGGSLGKCLAAADTLERDHGLSAEVIDLRTLRPLDIDTVLASLEKTHRAVVVDEGWKTGGLAGEMSAQVMELGFDLLDWPVLRVCGAEVPMPYAKHLEEAALPSPERVVAAVREMAF